MLDEKSKTEMLDTYCKMISIKSVSPASGGTGEGQRADYLESILKSWGFAPKRYTYKDTSNVGRPSLVVKHGDKERTLWILAHIDTVSEGDLKLWNTDPFKGTIVNEKIFGRGASDNGLAVIGGMYALKSLMQSDMKYNYGLILVADEEIGSKYGMQKLMEENIFAKDDMFVVPDAGSPDGSEIEIQEKSILWLRFTVQGKQVHASTPWQGINAFMEASKFIVESDKFLHNKYTMKTELMPKGSTFEVTKHEKNVESTNIIPGTEIFYMDCRVVPGYDLDKVVEDLIDIAKFSKAKISIEVVNREQAAPPTSANAEVVQILEKAIKDALNVKPKLVAIGGGTVAAYLRHAGFDAAVWGIDEGMAHQPNEYVKVSDLYKTIDVIEALFMGEVQKEFWISHKEHS